MIWMILGVPPHFRKTSFMGMSKNSVDYTRTTSTLTEKKTVRIKLQHEAQRLRATINGLGNDF